MGDRFQLISGERRLRAAVHAGWKTIPARVREADDRLVAELAIVFFQIVPIVAIAPLLVIWFGYGARAMIAAAFIVSIFPVIANTLTGLLSVDPALRDLFRLYGASRTTRLRKLDIPWALPFILTGLRIASGLAVIGAIVGEFVGGGGLGVVVLEAMRQQRTDLVFAAVGYASLLGLFLFGLVSMLTHFALRRWHALEQHA